MKNNVFALSLSFLMTFSVIVTAQTNDDPIILTVGKTKVTKSEFIRTYNKNNTQSTNDLKSVKDYMELFVNFKLKVEEAVSMGMDTSSSFTKEYNNYRTQLAKPYLYDAEMEQQIMKEAYARLKEEIHARQIFIRCGEWALPADTLEAYNKALAIRNRITGGEPWDSLVSLSDDKMAKKHMGDMGYFTVFQMMYPFESAVYSMKKGDVSMPIRTKFGYHVAQILDRRPSKGEIKVAHIMVAFPEDANNASKDSARAKTADIYNCLLAGEKFEELAKKYSDDKRSAESGGELKWFGVGQMIPEFERAAFNLEKDGEFSKPIKTSFGYHILKRISLRPVSSYDELKDFIKQQVNRDDFRLMKIYASFANKVANEVGFKDNKEKMKLLIPFLDSSIFKGKWDAAKAKSVGNEVLFTIGTKNYTLKEFSEYFAPLTRVFKAMPYESFLNKYYKEYRQSCLIEYENNRLEQKYSDLRFLLQEYHDGILLFNLMEKKIWNAAAQDSVGLQKYYDEHKADYKFGIRVDALIISTQIKDKANEALKYAADYQAGKIKATELLDKVCQDDSTKTCITVNEGLYEKGDIAVLDSVGPEPGISPVIFKDGLYEIAVKKNKLQPEQKTFQEAKGVVIADYQYKMEMDFIAELKKKYKYAVNEAVLESVVKELNK